MPTLNVRGQKVRVQSQRRFIVIGVRPEPVPSHGGINYVAYARVVKQTDSLDTAKRVVRNHDPGPGAFTVVYDTATEQEV